MSTDVAPFLAAHATGVAPSAGRAVPTARRLVLVAGSGRSGTSTIAGLLKEIGVHVPQPEVTPDNTNPKGFAEPQWLVDFHQKLLAQAHVQVSDARPSAWFDAGAVEVEDSARTAATQWLEDQFLLGDEVVLKDPRLIWFLGLWRAAAVRTGAEVSIVTMLRPPTEVVASKGTYYGHRGEIDSLAGWLNLMLHTERATRGMVREFVDYAALLEDWTVPVARIGERFDLAAVRSASASRINRAHQFVDPGLRRVSVGWDELQAPERLRDLTTRAWSSLVDLAAHDDEATHAALDALRAEYAAYYEEAAAIAQSSVRAASRRNERLRQRRDHLVAKRKELQAKVATLREERKDLAAENKRLRAQLREARDAAAQPRPAALAERLRSRVPEPIKRGVRRAPGTRGESGARS